MALQSLERFRGKRDSEALDPAKLQFEAKPVAGRLNCGSCIFKDQPSRVCFEAAMVARRANLPDCDEGFAYVAVERDPRQLSLVP